MNIESRAPEDSGTDVVATSGDNDMYMLLHKIQTDISEHEALMSRIMKRDAEYDMMKKAYEQKMGALQHQLQSILQERDSMLKVIKDPNRKKKDTGDQAHIIAIRYEERKKKLELQLNDYRKKLDENMRNQNENRSRNNALTKDLKRTIEAMKCKYFYVTL